MFNPWKSVAWLSTSKSTFYYSVMQGWELFPLWLIFYQIPPIEGAGKTNGLRRGKRALAAPAIILHLAVAVGSCLQLLFTLQKQHHCTSSETLVSVRKCLPTCLPQRSKPWPRGASFLSFFGKSTSWAVRVVWALLCRTTPPSSQVLLTPTSSLPSQPSSW